MGNAFAIHDVKICLTERRCHFVFDYLCTGMAADQMISVLDMLHTAHINTDGRIELQCTAAGGNLRIAVHHTHLFTQLVDKNSHTAGLCNDTCQLSQCLAHQTGMQAYKGIAHFTFNFRTGHQCCNRVHNNDIQCTGAYQLFCDFQTLVTAVRLGYQQAVHIYAQCCRIGRIQRMLRVNECRNAAFGLCRSNRMQSQRGFTRGFRSVNLNDSASWQSAYTQCHIQSDGAGGNHILIQQLGFLSQIHNGVLAMLLFNLCQCLAQRLLLIRCHRNGWQLLFLCHISLL